MNYVKELQSKLGLTVLMVTHNMKQVGGEYSDRVVVMNRGGVIDMVDSAENVFSASLGRREWGGLAASNIHGQQAAWVEADRINEAGDGGVGIHDGGAPL